MQLTGLHAGTRQPIAIHIEDGCISNVTPFIPDADEQLPFLAPGLVDLQVNGCHGYDFNSQFTTPDDVGHITRALLRMGVTAYLPTIITNSEDMIKQEIAQIVAGCANDSLSAQCILGIHLEGPFISSENGARGAHDPKYIRAPDWNLFERWQSVANGAIRIVTLSPEWPSSLEFIRRCVASGVMVSIGHTAASPERIREAVAAGARCSTHLGNGSHAMISRHDSYIWEQLASDHLSASFIADGHHLPLAFLKVALRAKGKLSMLVSDAVALSGMPPGEYHSVVGGRVVLTAQGKLHLAEYPNILAGSAHLLPHGIAHLVLNGLASLPEAWEMASLRPASLLNLRSKAGLKEGAPADIVVFRWNGQAISIEQVFKQGVRIDL